MSSTSPTPDGASGQAPAQQPSASHVPPLNALTPPTQPDLQQERVRTTHRIMGQRLVIQYETVQLADREALTTAEMRLLPPFGSSSTQSVPYTLKPDPGNLKAESSLIEMLHGLRDSKEPVQDREIIRQLRRVSEDPKEVAILYEAIDGNRPQREIAPMTFFAPDFNDLEGELDLFAARYLSSRIQNHIYEECMCYVDPKHNTVRAYFKQAYSTLSLRELEVIGASKDLPSNISEGRAMQLAWKNLTGIAETTMKTFQTYGAGCAMSALKSSLPSGRQPNYEEMPVGFDERLRLGIVRDFALDTVVTLRSGGRAVLDVGDHVAALCISASAKENCSTCCFVFDSKGSDHLSHNWDAHLNKIRSVTQMLASASPTDRRVALEYFSNHASRVFDRRCSVAYLIGDQAAQSLAALEEAGAVKVWLPNTSDRGAGRFELLEGDERIELTLAHFPGSQENLAAFSSAKVTVEAPGNIDIWLSNQLGNNVSVLLSEEAVTRWGGLGKVILSLAFTLSTRDVAQAHSKLHQLLEKMAPPGLGQVGPPGTKSISHGEFPSNNELDRRAFGVALGIVHTAHAAALNCHGNHTARMSGPSCAVAVVHLISAPYAIEFEIEHESLREVALRGKACPSGPDGKKQRLPTLRFAIPSAARPLLVQALPEIFADYYQYGGPRGYSIREPDALERTKIFQFLTTHGKRLVGERKTVRQGDEVG